VTGSVGNERLEVTYRLFCGEGENARDKARDIAYEQTVELPPACVGEAITERVVGRVERVEPGKTRSFAATISYDPELIGSDAAQLANLLFGNISLKSGIVVTGIEWPNSLLKAFGGPAHGIEALRAMTAAPPARPLLCGALKPVGLDPTELADICHRFATGGIDIIKDDHGLTDQPSAPFRQRVERCQEAVGRAGNGRTLYFPNVTGPAAAIEERVEFAHNAGCKGVMVAPLLAGLDCLQRIAREKKLAVLAHPSMTGAFFGDRHGIAPEVLLGDLFRVLGADGVIYPNVGGRFPFNDRTCHAINERLRGELGGLRRSFPTPGGGIDVKIVPHWLAQYGPDTILLIGGSLYIQSDLSDATRKLVEALERAAGIPG